MDKETIKQIAAEIAAQSPLGERTGTVLVLYVIFTAVAAGVAAWFGSFLKTKGQNFATKQDFNELQKRLEANTELVETIKAAVGQKDWTQREWITLRRTNLVTLLEKINECDGYLGRLRSHVIRNPVEPFTERNPRGELDAIATLLFPELQSQAREYSLAVLKQEMELSNFATEAIDAGDDPTAFKLTLDKYKERWDYQRITLAANELKAAAQRLMVSIMGVQD